MYKLDRFSRNKYEMAMHKKTLRDNGVKLLSAMENIPDTPEGIILESMKREDIIRYIKGAIKKNPKQMIRELVKKVILYDDKIQIYYNYTDNKKERKEADSEKSCQPFCFYNEEKVFDVRLYKLRCSSNVITLQTELYIY